MRIARRVVRDLSPYYLAECFETDHRKNIPDDRWKTCWQALRLSIHSPPQFALGSSKPA